MIVTVDTSGDTAGDTTGDDAGVRVKKRKLGHEEQEEKEKQQH